MNSELLFFKELRVERERERERERGKARQSVRCGSTEIQSFALVDAIV